MGAPKEDTRGSNAVNDEEAAPERRPVPGEISFHGAHHHISGFNDDDNTIPSELSTLIAPSTLTPNYSPGPMQMHGSHPSGGTSHDISIIRSHKAFQLAVLLGFMSIGVLFGADVVYMMVASSDHDVSQVSASAMSVNAFDGRNTSVRGGRGTVKNMLNNSDTGQAEGQGQKTSKKPKAKKTKAGKKEDKKRDDDHPENNISIGNQEEEEEKEYLFDQTEDELIVATPQIHSRQGFATPDMIATTVADAAAESTSLYNIAIPQANTRCPYVIDTFRQQNEGVTNMDFLRDKYQHQSADPNVFYRATALMFWKDFGAKKWGKEQNASISFEDLVLLKEARYEDGTPMSPMSTWTWITGDQHLSNFGAWRNRGGEVVFSVNDFDEGAIYDFHMDVLRIAVSICSHGFTNGLSKDEVKDALEAFTYTYVKTAIDYVGGDAALVYELNPDTSTGVLRDFLHHVEGKRSRMNLIHKFTEVGKDGARRFIRNDDTKLEDVPLQIEERIRAEITSTRYGASMMKMGWKVHGWDDDFFTVLDVARRVGSGIGSYGVDRFYVLLKGEGMLLEEDQDVLSSSVILDVKYEPVSAVSTILDEVDPETKAWYDGMFRNEADRSAQAQRRLTSYTDPYVGYLVIDGAAYNVRQRSPYKSSFDYGTLTNRRAFNEFMEQIAIATATAHVRGSIAKSPGQFKHVIKLLLAGDHNRRRWSELVANIALSYRSQVLLDFDCFKEYVKENFPTN